MITETGALVSSREASLLCVTFFDGLGLLVKLLGFFFLYVLETNTDDVEIVFVVVRITW